MCSRSVAPTSWTHTGAARQEFKGYARQVELAVDRSHKALNAIMELPSAAPRWAQG